MIVVIQAIIRLVSLFFLVRRSRVLAAVVTAILYLRRKRSGQKEPRRREARGQQGTARQQEA